MHVILLQLDLCIIIDNITMISMDSINKKKKVYAFQQS